MAIISKKTSSLLPIKYHIVNAIMKSFLKTGKTTKAQMGGDKKSKLSSEVKNSLCSTMIQTAQKL